MVPHNGSDPVSFVGDMVHGLECFEGALVPMLQALQREFSYLPAAGLNEIARLTPFTPAQISGAATFYSQFRLRPAGRHCIKVCIGTACHVKGAPRVIDAFRRFLEIRDGEDTDAAGNFTVEGVACLGCCMLAPAVQIDDLVYGPVEPGNVGNVLDDFLSEQRKEVRLDGRTSAGATRAGEMRICLCSSCRAAGADTVAQTALEISSGYGLDVDLREVACTGISFEAPLVEIVINDDDRRYRYGRVSGEAVESILLRHFRPTAIGARMRADLGRALDWVRLGRGSPPVTRYNLCGAREQETNFTGRQIRIATEHCGEMPPLDLAAYRENGGFAALARCQVELTPDDIIETIHRAGLRGRGGAGYPTADKWRHVRESLGEEKYMICNADEGDPGAFMDRMIIESFPYRVIEGMAIAARALEIGHGFIYVRAEYPLAVQRLQKAIADCEQAGFLDPLPDGELGLHLRVVEGAGAFVCGEETALIAAVEGGRGAPRLRPPYPAQRGLWGQPTLVNNVETFAMVPWILRNGPDRFAAIGSDAGRGTKTFALAGKVVRGGLIEVPMGMTLHEIVEEIGGGVSAGRTLKAIQVGGPSGGCVPASMADTPVDYRALRAVGAMMGSGGLVVLDDSDCMVDVARYFMQFIQYESCGKCTCCRIGTWEMLEILERLCAGKGRKGDVDELERLAGTVGRGSLCGLGRTAANPVLSTLRHFRSEYEAHVRGRCPARKCTDLIRFEIGDRCIGCTRCAQICPVDAIPPTPYQKHVIDDQLCIRCGACREACPQSAIRAVDI